MHFWFVWHDCWWRNVIETLDQIHIQAFNWKKIPFKQSLTSVHSLHSVTNFDPFGNVGMHFWFVWNECKMQKYANDLSSKFYNNKDVSRLPLHNKCLSMCIETHWWWWFDQWLSSNLLIYDMKYWSNVKYWSKIWFKIKWKLAVRSTF